MAAKKSQANTTPPFKQLRAWKVAVLGVVTLGVYFFLWLVLRRREVPDPKPRFSHWGWMLAIAFGFVSAVLALYLTAIIGMSDSAAAAAVIVYGLVAVAVVFEAITALWVLQIVTGINRTLGLPVRPVLVYLLGFFCAPLLIVYEQMAINRLHAPSAAKMTQLTQQFGWITLAGIALGVAFNAFSFFATPLDVTVDQVRREHTEVRKEIERIFQLAKEYTDCTDKLAREYPEGSATPGEDYKAYSAAYDKCQAIYDQITSQPR